MTCYTASDSQAVIRAVFNLFGRHFPDSQLPTVVGLISRRRPNSAWLIPRRRACFILMPIFSSALACASLALQTAKPLFLS